MFSRRYLAILPILLLIAAVTVRISGDDQVWFDLAPIPYEMKVPKDIAERLSVQDQAGDIGNEWTAQTYEDGAKAYVVVEYRADGGEVVGFMNAYYFSEADLDKTIFPDQVPPYGFKLIVDDGMALSIVGPQDSIFDPMSQDGKNISALYEILYEKKSYRFKG